MATKRKAIAARAAKPSRPAIPPQSFSLGFNATLPGNQPLPAKASLVFDKEKKLFSLKVPDSDASDSHFDGLLWWL
jgi:hypothetical protein